MKKTLLMLGALALTAFTYSAQASVMPADTGKAAAAATPLPVAAAKQNDAIQEEAAVEGRGQAAIRAGSPAAGPAALSTAGHPSLPVRTMMASDLARMSS